MVKLPTSVEAAVTKDLEDLAERDSKLAESSQAATALALARELDSENSATSKSMCAKALNETMAELRDLAPPEQSEDEVDAQRKKREARLAGKAAAKG